MATHFVQIVDEPRQIVALKGWYTLLIVLLMKYVAELIMKSGRGPVKAVKLLQGREVG